MLFNTRLDESALIWQRRFWEYTIKNEDDLRRCVDYCYINLVKHGLINTVADWSFYSFHRDVKRGNYHANWASIGIAINEDECGEL